MLVNVLLLSHVWSGIELSLRSAPGAHRGGRSAVWSPPEASVRVYAARTPLLGVAAIHTWIAMKRDGERVYDRYDVGVAGLRRGHGPPDYYWGGDAPRVLVEHRGPSAERLIHALEPAIQAYPHRRWDAYRLWPGANSNTFVAYLARSVPDLQLELPPTAIGKDYLVPGHVFGRTPSGTGYQVSLFGLVGGSVGVSEGLELNLLGMTVGIDPLDLAIKLPGVGQRGLR